MYTLDKTPHSKEAEIALLGSMIVHSGTMDEVVGREVTYDKFFMPQHKVLVSRMFEVYKERGAIDIHLLIDKIDNNEKDSRVIGGVDYLMYLIENAGAESSITYYIDLIEEKYQLRSVIELSDNFKLEASNVSGNIDDFMFDIEERVLNVTRSNKKVSVRDSLSIVKDMIEDYEKAQESGGGITGLKTGYAELDRVTGGLQNGDLIIVGARPSMGKTAFALNLALEVARRNKNGTASVCVFSLEMPDKHLMSRMASAISEVELNKIRSGSVNDTEDFNKFQEGVNQLQQMNVLVDDNSGSTLGDIFRQCRTLKTDDKLDLVVIDYLQLINSSGSQESRQQEISAISRKLKQLARELDVPVIALSQLSRKLESREDKTPVLSDLRESGSIEQDADVVMFLHREDYFGTEERPPISETLLRISKHRNGSLADIKLNFVPAIQRFYNSEDKYY